MARVWRKTVVEVCETQSGESRDHFAELMSRDAFHGTTPEQFIRHYMSGEFQGGRVGVAYDMLAARLKERASILSLASGNFAIEMRLERDFNCNILCTDQFAPPWLQATKKLFPDLQFAVLDPLKEEPPGQFSAVLCIGLTYLFDEAQIAQLFRFSSAALPSGGRLYININAPDRMATRVFHDLYLPLEARFLAIVKSVSSRRSHKVTRVAHGYHHDIEAIAQIAAENGFVVESVDSRGGEIDLHRSSILVRLLRLPLLGAVVRMFGKVIPYENLLTVRRR